jgi:hypothetical protein
MSKKLLSGVVMIMASVALLGAGCSGTSDNGGMMNGDDMSGLQTSADTVVTTPAANATVTSPLRIEGTTTNPELKIYARVIESDGSWNVTSEVMPQPDGTYVFNAVYMFSPTGPSITLELYNTDDSGREINMTQIPLTLGE